MAKKLTRLQRSQNAHFRLRQNAADIPGVTIAEDTKRVYNNSFYYSLIIGYTGKITQRIYWRYLR